MDENRKKALAAALSQIDKQFGKGTVMRLGETPASWDVETVSTGSLGLGPLALAWAVCRADGVTEVFGPEASGKTTLTLSGHCRGAACRRSCGIRRCGACAGSVLCGQTRRECRRPPRIAAGHRRAGARSHRHARTLLAPSTWWIIDSVAALTPKAEIEGRNGRCADGPARTLMSQALRKLTGNIKRSNTMVIFINQIRMKIGVMFASGDHDRRQRAQVLFVGASGHPPRRLAQKRRGGHRQPGPASK